MSTYPLSAFSNSLYITKTVVIK